MSKRPAPSVAPQASQEQSPSPSSLKDLISRGIAQSCTFSNDSTSGTVYVSSGKVREDFTATTDGKETKSHIIVDGNTSYMWTEGSKTGFKMTFDVNATPSAKTSTSQNGSFDASANINYKCGVWIVDSSLFALPTGVQFTSFGSTPATGSNSSQCSYCDSLSGDSKTQCLSALKCK